MSRRRRLFFTIITLGLALGGALLAGDLILTYQQRAIATSDSMDPGLIGYDPNLGWTLTPGWTGRHRHHDFDVTYSIGKHGFRGPGAAARRAERIALVGDSFTFGLGVEDGDTFARGLERDGREVLNFAVPGYSTDQELLLLERVVMPKEPDVVVLVVCLINDLFDNRLPFPLQARHAKPYFELESGELRLRAVPVPRKEKRGEDARRDLGTLTGAHEVEPPGGVLGWLGRRQVFRRLGLFQPTFDKGAAFFEGRYAEELALFGALVERMGQRVVARGGRFLVALLPGRSAVETPASFSSAYQDHLRLAIAERLGTRGVRVVDLTPPLRKAHTEGLGSWFHPHEGHLGPAGHAEVARLLNNALAEAPKEANSAPDGR